MLQETVEKICRIAGNHQGHQVLLKTEAVGVERDVSSEVVLKESLEPQP